MQNLYDHYGILLQLSDDWKVKSVQHDMKSFSVHVYLEDSMSKKVVCPKCGKLSSLYDRSDERSWKHLDTMQFRTILHAKVPRCKCENCGIKTVIVPWASAKIGFTLLFEEYSMRVLQISQSIDSARKFLGISWRTCNDIMKRSVDRGLLNRENTVFLKAGIDEKSFLSGHNYISALNDISDGKVIDVVEGRKEKDVDKLFQKLSEAQRNGIKAIAMDMWKPFINSAKTNLPNAEIVHDHFHVAKYLNNSVDIVRRKENKKLHKEGDDILLKTKYFWMKNTSNMKDEQQKSFDLLYKGITDIQHMSDIEKEDYENNKMKDLSVSKVWAIKENFKRFWNCINRTEGKSFFKKWYKWAKECEEKSMVNIAEMIKRHLPNILTYFKYRITNACSEGLNSKIQIIKSNARGFHSFESYRTRILFFCGKLEMSLCHGKSQIPH